jgi:hypothetical protein
LLPAGQQLRHSCFVDDRRGDWDAGEAGTEHATIAISLRWVSARFGSWSVVQLIALMTSSLAAPFKCWPKPGMKTERRATIAKAQPKHEMKPRPQSQFPPARLEMTASGWEAKADVHGHERRAKKMWTRSGGAAR